jgi:peptide deformylase
MVKLISAPNPVLSEIAKPVPVKSGRIDQSILKLIEQMKKVLLSASDPKGVGLAAPQVGKSLKIFLAKPTDKSAIMTFINPEIVQISPDKSNIEKSEKENESKTEKLEGCLSLPNIWGPVLRSPLLTLEFFDEKGTKHKQKFKGFMATIIQHETDHLNGVLFPKRVLEQSGTLYKSHKNKKGEDEFEEIEI